MGQRRWARHQVAAVVLTMALVVGGCTSQADISGTTLDPITGGGGSVTSSSVTQSGGTDGDATSSSQPVSSAETTTSEGSTEASVSTTTAATSEPSVTSSADVPWAGLDLTEAQIADAEAAVAAYRGYSAAVDQSLTD
ncbi:MAG: hypothetical protein ABIR83_16350, partial [Nakamurella sp.]